MGCLARVCISPDHFLHFNDEEMNSSEKVHSNNADDGCTHFLQKSSLHIMKSFKKFWTSNFSKRTVRIFHVHDFIAN